MDRGRVDFERLFTLHRTGRFFVIRAKSNTKYRSVAIFRATRNGVCPISGANNGATAIARVRPGAHSARHQDSRNDLTPCRMAWHFVSDGAHVPHSDQTLGPTPTRGGQRTPLVAYPPSLPCAPPRRRYSHPGDESGRCSMRSDHYAERS